MMWRVYKKGKLNVPKSQKADGEDDAEARARSARYKKAAGGSMALDETNLRD